METEHASRQPGWGSLLAGRPGSPWRGPQGSDGRHRPSYPRGAVGAERQVPYPEDADWPARPRHIAFGGLKQKRSSPGGGVGAEPGRPGPWLLPLLDEPRGAGPLPQGPLALRPELLLWMMLKTERGSVMEPAQGCPAARVGPGRGSRPVAGGPPPPATCPLSFRATGRGGRHSALIGEHEQEGEGAIHQVGNGIGVFQEHVSQGGGKVTEPSPLSMRPTM